MKDRVDNLNLEYISLIEVEVSLDINMIREDFKTGLDQTMHTEDDQGMDKTIDVGHDMILIIEVATDIIQEVIKGMGDWIIIIEGETLGNRIIIETGVGHTKDRTEIERMVEVLVTVDECQVQGWLQTEIGSYALSVENMTILQGTVQLDRQVGKQNKYSKHSIWMRIRQYYKLHWWM